MVRNAKIGALFAAALAVAGCGGNGEQDPGEGTEVPQTAPTDGDDGAPTGDQVDLTAVDPCSLVDEATIQQVTGESVGFTTQDLGDFPVACFWGRSGP